MTFRVVSSKTLINICYIFFLGKCLKVFVSKFWIKAIDLFHEKPIFALSLKKKSSLSFKKFFLTRIFKITEVYFRRYSVKYLALDLSVCIHIVKHKNVNLHIYIGQKLLSNPKEMIVIDILISFLQVK